jgi:hypothetical protein
MVAERAADAAGWAYVPIRISPKLREVTAKRCANLIEAVLVHRTRCGFNMFS